MDGELVTEVPSALKQLARLVVHSFYTVEDALIIDMLVRNPCVKEDDISEILKFDRKMIRARINTLKNDKFIHTRLRMQTGADGKAQKVNYYFINYKSFVNVVKYKLDVMRKKMEIEERDATSRANLKCKECFKTFTVLEADMLIDFATGLFFCTHCKNLVEEDTSALSNIDTRMMMAKFNDQLEPIFVLLRRVEGIKLAPNVLEPEPCDLSSILGTNKSDGKAGEIWSGEATRHGGNEESRIDITIGDDAITEGSNVVARERPVWLSESTIIDSNTSKANIMVEDTNADDNQINSSAISNKNSEDIMSVLLQHEKRSGLHSSLTAAIKPVKQESDSDSDEPDKMGVPDFNDMQRDVEIMRSDDEDDDDVPTVTVGGRKVPLSEVDDALIRQMTKQEREYYIQIYQEYYSNLYE